MITRTIDFIDMCIRNDQNAIKELTEHLEDMEKRRVIELQKMTLKELWEYTGGIIDNELEDFPI